MTEPNTTPAVISQEPAAAPEAAAPEASAPAADKPQTYKERIAALVAEDPAPAPPEPAAPDKPADKPAETPPAQTEQDKALAEAALKEGKAWRLQQQLKREQEQLRASRAEWQPKVEQVQKLEAAIAKGDIVGAMHELAGRVGKPFHELYFALSKQIADSTTDRTPQQIAEEAAERKLAAYKAEQEAAAAKAQAEQQERQRASTREQETALVLQQVTTELADKDDRWPVLSGEDPRMVAGSVLHEMTADYAKKRAEHGKDYADSHVLDFSEALDIIERRQQAKARTAYERMVAKQKPPQAAVVAAPAAPPAGQTAGRPRTIEHSHVADAATPRKLTYQERLAQLIAEDDRKG